jgi:choline-glycine betaine transporter
MTTKENGNALIALGALQSAAIISALPFSFVVILMMISFYKDANQALHYVDFDVFLIYQIHSLFVDIQYILLVYVY